MSQTVDEPWVAVIGGLLVGLVGIADGGCGGRGGVKAEHAAAAPPVERAPAAPTPAPDKCSLVETVSGGDPAGIGLQVCTTPAVGGRITVSLRRIVDGAPRVLWSEVADGLAAAYLMGSDPPQNGQVVILVARDDEDDDGDEDDDSDDSDRFDHIVVGFELVGDTLNEVTRFVDSGD